MPVSKLNPLIVFNPFLAMPKWRIRATVFMRFVFLLFLLTSANLYAKEAMVLTDEVGISASKFSNDDDSTSLQKAQHDVDMLKDMVTLSNEQEEIILNMFLGKYQYLEVHDASGGRWELIMRTQKRKLKETLGESSFSALEEKGLIEIWFGN